MTQGGGGDSKWDFGLPFIEPKTLNLEIEPIYWTQKSWTQKAEPKSWTQKLNPKAEPKKAEPKKLNPKVQLLGSEFGFRLQFSTSGLEKKVHILGLGTRFTIRCNIMCSMVHVAIVRTRHASATRESRHDGASWSYTTSRVSFMRVGDATATRRCVLCVYGWVFDYANFVCLCVSTTPPRETNRCTYVVRRIFCISFIQCVDICSANARRSRGC